MAEVKKDLKLVRGDDPMSIASLTQTREDGHELTVGREEESKGSTTTNEEED